MLNAGKISIKMLSKSTTTFLLFFRQYTLNHLKKLLNAAPFILPYTPNFLSLLLHIHHSHLSGSHTSLTRWRPECACHRRQLESWTRCGVSLAAGHPWYEPYIDLPASTLAIASCTNQNNTINNT